MVRNYADGDYEQLKELYAHTEWYGGVFDEARDGRARLRAKITNDPEAISVYEAAGEILGSISIIDDGRVAMLYRFVVQDFDQVVTNALHSHAISLLHRRGHTQVLVYSSVHDEQLDARYLGLGMTRGGDYACFWQEI